MAYSDLEESRRGGKVGSLSKIFGISVSRPCRTAGTTGTGLSALHVPQETGVSGFRGIVSLSVVCLKVTPCFRRDNYRFQFLNWQQTFEDPYE